MTTENYVQEYEQICSLFRDEWNAANTNVPVVWENVKASVNGKQSFVGFFVLNGDSAQVSVGNPESNRFRHAGVVMVNLYSESGVGKIVALGLVDIVVQIFRRRRIGSIRFLDPKVTPLGNEGNFFKYNVTVAFYRDSYHNSNGGNEA